MATLESAQTQNLINSKCLIDRELFLRRFYMPRVAEHSGCVTLTNIPHGYQTLDVYHIVAAYGSIRKIRWAKNPQGYELNTLHVTYWNYEDARSLREAGTFYRTMDHPEFRRKVYIV